MADKEKKYTRILDFLSKRNQFLITAHLGADGDAYGAALAMAYLLEQWGKEYQIIFHDSQKDEKYKYLWGWGQIISYSDLCSAQYKNAIVVDVPSKKRIGNPALLLPSSPNCVKIDHHPLEEDFAECTLVDTSASSTCQLVYEIIVRSDIEFTHDLASLLLSGIMYDTGRFSFSSTNQRDFEIAAHLLSYGVNPSLIADHLFFSNDFESLKVVGYGLANMESHLDGKVCLIYLPLEIIGGKEQLDLDELANFSLAIKDVEVGLFVRQSAPELVKVSFRSKGNVDVNKIARCFGGGGHIHAAGCRTSEEPAELKRKLLLEIKKQL